MNQCNECTQIPMLCGCAPTFIITYTCTCVCLPAHTHTHTPTCNADFMFTIGGAQKKTAFPRFGQKSHSTIDSQCNATAMARALCRGGSMVMCGGASALMIAPTISVPGPGEHQTQVCGGGASHMRGDLEQGCKSMYIDRDDASVYSLT